MKIFILIALSFSVQAWAQECETVGTGTVLQRAAMGLAAGTSCELATDITADLVKPPGSGACQAETHLEYSSEGVYYPGKFVRILLGPHSGGAGGTKSVCEPEEMVLLKYDEKNNAWSIELDQRNFGIEENLLGNGGGHGYDQTAMNPQNGDTYVATYCGGAQTKTPCPVWKVDALGNVTAPKTNKFMNGEPASGFAFDERRGGVVVFNDSGRVSFWNGDPSTEWTQLNSRNPGTLKSYHFWAGYHPPTGRIWLQDGNGSNRHWLFEPDNLNDYTTGTASPTNLGCCGIGGVLTAYDYRTQKFVLLDPHTNQMWDFDPGASGGGMWRTLEVDRVPMSLTDVSNVEGFVVPMNVADGVLMYVAYRGTTQPPKVFLYKHN